MKKLAVIAGSLALLAPATAEAFVTKKETRKKTEQVAKRLCNRGCVHYAAKNCRSARVRDVGKGYACDAIDNFPGSIGKCVTKVTLVEVAGVNIRFLGHTRCDGEPI